jgi:type VI protein secretion system component VasF
VRGVAVSPREPAASSRHGTHRELARAETRRVAPRWVVVAIGVTILLVSLLLLTYVLRRPQVSAGSAYVRPLASAWLAPIAVDATRTASYPS